MNILEILEIMADPYDRKARLYPGLLVIAPIILIVATVLSWNLVKSLSVTAIVCIAVGYVAAFLLSQFVRDAGKECEEGLFKEWGGIPSVAIFRHSDTRLDAITKERYHKIMASMVGGVNAPSIEEEQSNPLNAEKTYMAWSTYLRTNTRDTKQFSLLFKENMNYGFRRNVLGLRPIGIRVCVVSCLISVAWACFLLYQTWKITPEVSCLLFLSIVLLCFWLFIVSKDWVRIPAYAYAERLVETIDDVANRNRSGTKKNKK